MHLLLRSCSRVSEEKVNREFEWIFFCYIVNKCIVEDFGDFGDWFKSRCLVRIIHLKNLCINKKLYYSKNKFMRYLSKVKTVFKRCLIWDQTVFIRYLGWVETVFIRCLSRDGTVLWGILARTELFFEVSWPG